MAKVQRQVPQAQSLARGGLGTCSHGKILKSWSSLVAAGASAEGSQVSL